MRRILMIMAITALFHNALFAELYIWTDENGVKHCSSTPPPDKYKISQYKEMESSPGTPSKTQGSPGSRQAGAAKTTKSKELPKVVMYSTQWCGYCKKAKAWLTQNHVPFTEYDIESSEAYQREYKAQGGTGGVPFFVVGDEKMKGWSEEHMKQLLEMAE